MAGYRVGGRYVEVGQPRAPSLLDGDVPTVEPVVVVAPRLPAARSHSKYYVGHPGTLESFIPVWGSGREAIADFQDGDYIGAGFNTLLAISDFIPAEASANAIRKGAFKGGGHSWSATRAWMKKQGYFKVGQEGHHWIVPQGRWGKAVPNWIKNQPWNIKPLERSIHRRIETKFMGEPRLNPFDRYWYGTPDWSKAATVSAVGHPASSLGRRQPER